MSRSSTKMPDGQTLKTLPTQVIEGDFGEVLVGGYEGVEYKPWSTGETDPRTRGRVMVTVTGHDHVTRLSLTAEDVDKLTWALVDASKWAREVDDAERVVKVPRHLGSWPIPMGDQEGGSDDAED